MSMALPADPAPSRWRRALFITLLVGIGVYAGGIAYFVAESNAVNIMVPIMALMLGPTLAMAGFALWWLIRGPGTVGLRFLGVGGMVALAAAFVFACHPNSRGFVFNWGIGSVFAAAAIPLLILPRRFAWVGVLTGIAAAAPWLATRIEGVTGDFQLVFKPRFAPTAEQAAVAFDARTRPPATAKIDVPALTPGDWPGFRGGNRDALAAPEALAGWTGAQPRELWRHPVGPAWSSFATVGNLAFTQEQRDKDEVVVCYKADTGETVWKAVLPERHEDNMAGPGPRATPTYADGRVFTLGATNVLSATNAADGKPLWSVKLADTLKAEKPIFGAAASPLVVGNLVIVNPGAKDAGRLAAFDAATGEKRWATDGGSIGYSSPHLAKIDDVSQVLIYDGDGIGSFDPLNGKKLWDYEWVANQTDPASVQPLVLPDGRVIVGGGGMGAGTRCLRPRYRDSQWSVEELWKTTRFTPKFSDSVVVGDYLYGLDRKMTCVNLADGKVMWKDGSYGAGQVVRAGDKLLVIAESGQLACVDPNPGGWKELWHVDGLKGKSWNHMAVAQGRLLLRNAEEAAAFALPTK